MHLRSWGQASKVKGIGELRTRRRHLSIRIAAQLREAQRSEGQEEATEKIQHRLTRTKVHRFASDGVGWTKEAKTIIGLPIDEVTDKL